MDAKEKERLPELAGDVKMQTAVRLADHIVLKDHLMGLSNLPVVHIGDDADTNVTDWAGFFKVTMLC